MANNRTHIWTERRDIPLTILAWFAVIFVIVSVLAHISKTLLLLLLAAVLAYTVAPAIQFFERLMPKALAILMIYILVLGCIGVFFYFVLSTALHQLILLGHYLQKLIVQNPQTEISPLVNFLQSFGISKEQISQVGHQLTSQAESAFGSIFPFIKSFFNYVFDIIIILIVSIYLVLDGARVAKWIQENSPRSHKSKVLFALFTLERIVGAYIRGQLLLAVIIGVLVGIGMLILQVPYAILLGVLAFICSFIPIIGTFVSGVACVLLALTHGWVSALIVLAYFIGIHVLEGDILGPRIVGKALGLHPLVALLAVITGTELFGIPGAFFAAPITGLAQAISITAWKAWKEGHPAEFVNKDLPVQYKSKKNKNPSRK